MKNKKKIKKTKVERKNISVRSLQLVVVEEDKNKKNESYQMIRDSIYAQYRGLNKCMGFLASEYYACNGDFTSERFKNAKKSLTNSILLLQNINFGTGIDSKSLIITKVKQDLESAIKNGLAKGERTISNYKRDFPLMTRGRDLKFSKERDRYYIKWVNGITFEIVTGVHKSKELLATLDKVIAGEYIVSQSLLFFNSKNKLILNLYFVIPVKPITPNPSPPTGRYVGVDLGLNNPAYVSVSDNDYIRKAIGKKEDIKEMREKIRRLRRREMVKLTISRGGHGRKRKLASMDRFKAWETNYARTLNHFISKEVINFSVKNKAVGIKLEALTKDGMDENILGKWGYHSLLQMIKYKAERIGIPVYFIEPRNTSKMCSKCGFVSTDNRKNEKFICIKCGYEANADFNASQNIARSINFVDIEELEMDDNLSPKAN